MIPLRALVLGLLMVVGPLALILGAWWGFLSISSFLVGTLAIALVRTRQVVGPGPVDDRVWLGHLGRALRGSVVLLGVSTVPSVMFLFILGDFLIPLGHSIPRVNPLGTFILTALMGWPCSMLVRRWLGWRTSTRKSPEIRADPGPVIGPMRVSVLGLMMVIALTSLMLGAFRVHRWFGGFTGATLIVAVLESRAKLQQSLLDPSWAEIHEFGRNLFVSALLVAGAAAMSLGLLGDFVGLGMLTPVNSSLHSMVVSCAFFTLFVFCCVLVRRGIRWSFRMDET